MPNIKEIALKVASEMQWCQAPHSSDLNKLFNLLETELAKGNEPVAWMYEYSYDLNGDKQGHWPVDMHTHVSFSRSKPSVEATPLYTLPPPVSQIEQETAEACAKVCGSIAERPDHLGATDCEAAIESGAWKEFKK